METPNSSTNSKGVKVDSYDWESNSDSCPSSEDSPSNTFGDNDVDGEREGEEFFGLPCCHMIVVMKYEHLSTIPPSLVMRRWTRCGRPPAQQPNVCQISRSISHMARYGILSSGYKLMSFYASHAHDSFEDARQVEHEMTSWMRKRWEMGKNKECNTKIGESSDGQTLFGVGDPPVVKTKGNPGNETNSS